MFGLSWFLFCQFTMKTDEEIERYPNNNNENFITYNDMVSMPTNLDRMWLLTYYFFTTLSTVGLGDYNPRSDVERLMIIFVMVFGVIFTTIIMDTLNKVITEMGSFNQAHDESSELSLFIKVLERFNKDESLNRNYVASI